MFKVQFDGDKKHQDMSMFHMFLIFAFCGFDVQSHVLPFEKSLFHLRCSKIFHFRGSHRSHGETRDGDTEGNVFKGELMRILKLR